MTVSRFISSLMVLIAVVSCGSVENTSRGEDVMLKSSLSSRPAWVNSTGTIKGSGEMRFVGRSSGAGTEADAVQLATNDAFAKLSSHFGVSVKSDFISSEQETDGNYTYSIGLQSKVTGSKITVKNYIVSGSYIEQWQRSAREYDAFVMVTVPDSEIARIRVEVEGTGSWHIECKSQEAVAKTKELMQVLNEKRGIKFKPAQSAESADAGFEKLQTAYHLSVKCEIGKTAEYNGEFYTNLRTTVELISLIDGKVLESWNADVKGGAFSKEDSLTKAVEDSFRQITGCVR